MTSQRENALWLGWMGSYSCQKPYLCSGAAWGEVLDGADRLQSVLNWVGCRRPPILVCFGCEDMKEELRNLLAFAFASCCSCNSYLRTGGSFYMRLGMGQSWESRRPQVRADSRLRAASIEYPPWGAKGEVEEVCCRDGCWVWERKLDVPPLLAIPV